MAKLEYNKENYLIKPKKLLETLEVFNPTNDTETLYRNKNVITGSENDINDNVIVSQLVRLVSLLSKSVDISALPQAQQDSINTTIALFETYPMMGDQMLATDGRIRLEQAMINQETYASNNAEVTGEEIITDPYQGFENIAKTSPYDQATRELLIDELVQQSALPFGDYEEVDRNGMSQFIDHGDKYTMTGTYGNMPGGREVYEVVGQDELASVNSGWVITQHMAQDTYFDTTENIFKK